VLNKHMCVLKGWRSTLQDLSAVNKQGHGQSSFGKTGAGG
jgi:hypothetical protein